MIRKNWTLLVIPVVLFLYLVVGVMTKRTGEIFPIFHWGLFAGVDSPVSVAEVYLLEVDGERYTPPVRLQDTEEYQRQVMSDYDIYISPNVVRRFAAAYEGGRFERAAQLEEAFEENFLEGDRVRYTLVDVTFEPVERYRTGEVLGRETIGSFSKGLEGTAREPNR